MDKSGMRRPDPKQPHGTESNHKARFPDNDAPPPPATEIGKKSNKKAHPTGQ